MFFDSRKACINCFNDPILKEIIETDGSIGDCSWCGSTEIKTIWIADLSEQFRMVAGCYDEITGPEAYLNGESIAYWLQNDWGIFSDRIDDEVFLQEMTSAILIADTEPKEQCDFPDYSGFFIRQMPDLEFEWYDKLYRILSNGKNIPAATSEEEDDGYPSRLEFAIESCLTNRNEGEIFWRARIHKDRKRKKRFDPSEMGAPKSSEAKAGRANRDKESVLYLASDYKTALAEVRSWRGMAVAVAQVRLVKDIRILDLTDLHYPQSPFKSEYLCYDLQVLGLLQSFGSALSRPLLPGEDIRSYLPSQGVCDFVLKKGADGILYPSGMGPGNNMVLFDPGSGEPISVDYYRIGTPEFFPELIHTTDDIYDDWPYDHLIDNERGA